MTISFLIPGKPAGKGRPRRGAHGVMYTPKDTREYEQAVKSYYAYTARGACFRDRAIYLRIAAYYPIPKNASKKAAAEMRTGVVRPKLKPDGDNVQKIIADALNGTAYDDDKQIVRWYCEKWYSDEPHVLVQIGDIGDDEEP